MPESRTKRIRDTLLKSLKDEYGGSDEDWVEMQSLKRIVAAIEDVVGPDLSVEVTQSLRGSEAKIWRDGVLIFDGVDRAQAMPLSRQSQCTHEFPDGTKCRMAVEYHKNVPGLAELHGLA